MFMLRSTHEKIVQGFLNAFEKERNSLRDNVVYLREEVQRLNAKLAAVGSPVPATLAATEDKHANTRFYFHRMGLDVSEFCATHWGIGNGKVIAADYWPTTGKWRLRKPKTKTLHGAAFLVRMLSKDENW